MKMTVLLWSSHITPPFLNDDDIARMVYRIDLMLGCVLGCEDVQVDSISIMDQDEITQVIHGVQCHASRVSEGGADPRAL